MIIRGKCFLLESVMIQSIKSMNVSSNRLQNRKETPEPEPARRLYASGQVISIICSKNWCSSCACLLSEAL